MIYCSIQHLGGYIDIIFIYHPMSTAQYKNFSFDIRTRYPIFRTLAPINIFLNFSPDYGRENRREDFESYFLLLSSNFRSCNFPPQLAKVIFFSIFFFLFSNFILNQTEQRIKIPHNHHDGNGRIHNSIFDPFYTIF